MTDAVLPAIPGEPDDQAEPKTVYADVTGRGERKPLVAEQWQRHNFRATVRQLAGLHWYKSRYHLYRTHIYVPRILFYTVRGAFRLVMTWHRWMDWKEGYELVSMAVAKGSGGHGEAMRAHTEGEKTRARRARKTLVYVLPAVAAFLLMLK